MDVMLPLLMLFAVLAVWAFLPFQPALRELREKRDIEPVRVVQDSEVDIHYFARGYRSFVSAHFAEAMERSRTERIYQEGRLEDGTTYVVVDGNADLAPRDITPETSYPHLIVSCGGLRLPARGVFPLEVYAEGSVAGGETSIYRAILASGNINLGRQTIGLRWLHAGGTIRTEKECQLHGRVSADRQIELAQSTHFERLFAPRIVFGDDAGLDSAVFRRGSSHEPSLTSLESTELKHVVQVAAGRWLVKGRMRVPPDRRVEADLVGTNDVEIGERTHVYGSIKSHRDLVVRRGAVVEGSVVSGRNLYVEEGCRIHGPVLAERSITLGPGCEIGSREEPTTVSARQIRVLARSVAHGTVWAHQVGVVVADETAEVRA